MVAVINNVVGGAALALALHLLLPAMPTWADVVAGIAAALVLTLLFYAYQRWRFGEADADPLAMRAE
jgi:membrane protein implicated in regulation of membrane protease activity